ncbi:uncharacterized protein Eint_091490 [Encephalitozoon intestinalis ATCC 50506]|uniref:Uncharacterized protein n=1 Tax=Encephalitozoon intestinalis (strain ATCC 50506) TaxID=876142 RepID=E0S912_ENCIT|nr:uncharacterized protein Eint_091490 [Encephalitozoon intestinalis ATCC 50506]ADM12277.1 hypothetical protein Eint_091490 [Encephalitozoon intestinalis ATCC 50506]UTX46085.1 hypothetical protein GPK93_09g16720 [Encephalitozoon intestinalis]
MNVRPRKSASKYSFEPKIPQNQELFEVEESKEKKEFVLGDQGEYAPKSMDQGVVEYPFILGKEDGVVLTLPSNALTSKIIVYEDGSCGLKIGDEIHPIATRFIGESLAIEHKDMAYNIGSAKFQLTPQVQDSLKDKSP